MSQVSILKSNSIDKTQPVVLPVICVNGRVIEEKSLSEEIQYHPAQSIDFAIQKAGQALVIHQLLKQQAERKNILLSNEDEAFEKLLDSQVSYKTVSQEDCQRYYNQNREKFMTAPLLEVSHILLSVAPDDIEGRVNKKREAQMLITQLKNNIKLFRDFVREYSDCPSNKTDGSLGQVSKGQTVEEFERQIFSLKEGLFDNPVESRYGYHIVFINKKIEGKQLDYIIVEDKVREYLNHRRYRQAISDYLYQLVDESSIEGIELKIDQENIFFG